MHSLVHEGNSLAAAAHLKDLSNALRDTQPNNVALTLRVCKPIARLACGDTAILSQTLAILQRLSGRVGNGPQAQRGVSSSQAAGISSELGLELIRQQLLSGMLLNYSFFCV